MDLTSVEIVLLALVFALLVMVLVQSQRLSNIKDRLDRIERSTYPGVVPSPGPTMASGMHQGPAGLPAEVDLEVRRLIASGKKINAIKLVREQTGLGLKEAKDIVDAY